MLTFLLLRSIIQIMLSIMLQAFDYARNAVQHQQIKTRTWGKLPLDVLIKMETKVFGFIEI